MCAIRILREWCSNIIERSSPWVGKAKVRWPRGFASSSSNSCRDWRLIGGDCSHPGASWKGCRGGECVRERQQVMSRCRLLNQPKASQRHLHQTRRRGGCGAVCCAGASGRDMEKAALGPQGWTRCSRAESEANGLPLSRTRSSTICKY